jgi:hypothetical protein
VVLAKSNNRNIIIAVRITFLTGLVLFFLIAQPALARSGCCSHHGGVQVNGCGCNDGTSLSSTCAPYYVCTINQPEKVQEYVSTDQINTPTSILIPTTTLAPTFSPKSIFAPTASMLSITPLLQPSNTAIRQPQSNFLVWFFGLFKR